MGLATFSFREEPARTRGGMVAPEYGTVVHGRPVTRPMSNKRIAKLLKDALDSMENGGACTFWACKGPQYPRHMVTCSRCWAVRDIQRAIRHLEGGR
jgi:hypothetical protein